MSALPRCSLRRWRNGKRDKKEKWELFRKFPFLLFKLSTLCRQLEIPRDATLRIFGYKKTAPGREPNGRLDIKQKRQKKKQPLTVTHIRFLTQSRATSPCSWYLTSWLPLFLQIFAAVSFSGLAIGIFNGFSSPSSKVRHAFGRRSRWRIPSSCIRFPFLGSFLYVTDLHPLWLYYNNLPKKKQEQNYTKLTKRTCVNG